MQIRLASKITTDSIVDGLGLRMVVWMQGCIHNCPFCHNPQTHALDGGFVTTVDEVVDYINSYSFKSGVTISGGDPFVQKEALLELVKKIKESKTNIWVYTGYDYEQLLANDLSREILNYIDVLVDGKFINELKNDTLRFKGSTNQRIIDVQQSLKLNKVIELDI